MGRRSEELTFFSLECKSRKHPNLIPLVNSGDKEVSFWGGEVYLWIVFYLPHVMHSYVPILHSTIRIISNVHTPHSEEQFLACASHFNRPVGLQNPITCFWLKWQLKSLFSTLRQRLEDPFFPTKGYSSKEKINIDKLTLHPRLILWILQQI